MRSSLRIGVLGSTVGLLLAVGVAAAEEQRSTAAHWQEARARSERFREAMSRADRVLQAWLLVIDPQTGLAPESYQRDHRWTVANSAADLYSSLVMVAAFTDQQALDGVLRRALATERAHAQRIGRLPDDLDLKTLAFVRPEPSLARSTFGASEWCRDGLLRITEILGTENPWYDRMLELVDEIMTRAAVPTRSGPIPRGDHEVDGEMLQVLSRLYFITGDDRYRTWAERIGDYHLFEKPTQRSTRLRLRDHGGEIIAGLSELFVMTSKADPAKAAEYEPPLRGLLDRVLEVGRAPDGMVYDVINPLEGKVVDRDLIDTWGYVYNAYRTYEMVTGSEPYRSAIEKALQSLVDGYADHRWGGSDDYADTIESAIVLQNRLHVEGIEEWIAETIPRMWAMQESDGTVNRRYDDGSFARTSILFAGLLSQGVRVEPWREDLALGAVLADGDLYLVLRADRPWTGRLRFDRARSRLDLHLPVNYPRINELPEWYAVSESADYVLTFGEGDSRQVSGAALVRGLDVSLEDPLELRVVVQVVPTRSGAP